MNNTDGTQLIHQAIAAAEAGNTLVALLHFEDAAKTCPNPKVASYLGFCLARERRQFKQAVALCLGALKAEPGQGIHYLNLARVYLDAGQKALAIKSLRQGLKAGQNRAIINQLKSLGLRKGPVFSGLARQHPLNRYAGMIFDRFGLR